MSTSKVCPKCGWNIFLENHKYCFGCGAELIEVEEEKCECGEDKFGDNYCPYCGQKHEEATTTTMASGVHLTEVDRPRSPKDVVVPDKLLPLFAPEDPEKDEEE